MQRGHADKMHVLCMYRAAVPAQDAAAVSSDEEDDFVYNPLKLPMGWDGKPIPYWLYKLHGLNQVPLLVLACPSLDTPRRVP